MKAAKGSIGRTLDQPPAHFRFYLFHGPDEGQSRALGERLVKALAASRMVLSSAALRSDPALLADEACAMNLFGGARVVWVEPAGEEIATALEGLLEAPGSESPAIAIAGALRKTSALLKLAEAHPQVLAHASYLPEGQNAERMVAEVGRTFGLNVPAAVAARIADACGSDQAIAARELEKLALYVGASPETPKELDHAALDAVGAAMPEGNFLALADLALAGDIRALVLELAGGTSSGSEAIPVVRSLQRRLLTLAPARARLDRGESPSAVMASFGKALFWKDKDRVAKLLAIWDSVDIQTLFERSAALERQLMLSDVPAAGALGEELVSIARSAARRR